MSDTITGSVVKVYNKKVGGGKYTRWSFLLSDDNWYNCGLTKPKVKDGDEVEFTSTFDDKYNSNNVDMDSLVVVGSSNSQAAPANKSAPKASGGASTKDDYWARKEKADVEWRENQEKKDLRLQWQGARTSALSFVDLFIRNGGTIDMGKTVNKQLDTFKTTLDAITLLFFQDNADSDALQELLDIPAEMPKGKGKRGRPAASQEVDDSDDSDDEDMDD